MKSLKWHEQELDKMDRDILKVREEIEKLYRIYSTKMYKRDEYLLKINLDMNDNLINHNR